MDSKGTFYRRVVVQYFNRWYFERANDFHSWHHCSGRWKMWLDAASGIEYNTVRCPTIESAKTIPELESRQLSAAKYVIPYRDWFALVLLSVARTHGHRCESCNIVQCTVTCNGHRTGKCNWHWHGFWFRALIFSAVSSLPELWSKCQSHRYNFSRISWMFHVSNV